MKKKISTIVTVLISLIALYSIVWFAYSELVFSKYITDEFEKTPVSGFSSRVKEVDGYILTVKKPDYGTFTGNLSITDQQSNISMLIWPSLMKGAQYHLIINDGTETFYIDVDEHFSPLENNSANEQVIKKYAAALHKQREMLQETWGLFEGTDDAKN